MTEDSFSHNIDPTRMYNEGDIPWLFSEKTDRLLAKRLIAAGIIPKEKGKVVGKSLLEGMQLRDKIVDLSDVAEQFGVDPAYLSKVVHTKMIPGPHLQCYGQGPAAVYLLAKGVARSSALENIHSALENSNLVIPSVTYPTVEPAKRAVLDSHPEASTPEPLPKLKPSRHQDPLVIEIGKLCQKLHLPQERYRRAAEAGALDEYLQFGNPSRTMLHREEQREPLLAFLQKLARAKTLGGVAAQLGYDPETFALLLPQPKRSNFLEQIVGKGDLALYVYQTGVTVDRLITYLKKAEPNLKKRSIIREELRQVQRLMLLQMRDPWNMKFAGGVEFLLQGHAQLEKENDDQLQELEHRQLNVMIGKLSAAMNGSAVRKARAIVEKNYGCSLEGLLLDSGEEIPASAYGIASPEGIITIPRLSGRLGLDPEVLRELLARKSNIRDKYLQTIGGNKRQPQYRLQEGKSVEDFAGDLLVDYESNATKGISARSSSRPGSDQRILFRQGRWADDKMYDAKVHFWQLGDPHARLRNGYAFMNLQDREVVREMAAMTKERLPPQATTEIERHITLIYGEEWTLEKPVKNQCP